jgi:hypothetical protein
MIDMDTGDYYWLVDGSEAYQGFIEIFINSWESDWDDFDEWFNRVTPNAIVAKELMRVAWFASRKGMTYPPMAN